MKHITIYEFLQGVKNLPYKDELVLQLKHKKYRNIFLRIWISSNLNNSWGVYIRIDHTNRSSVPLCKSNVYARMFEETIKLIRFYKFGKTPISDLFKILDIVKDLKPTERIKW